MTEKNIFPSSSPLKIEVLSPPPFQKFGRRFNPQAERGEGEGAHYDSIFSNNNSLTSSRINLLNNLICEIVDCKKECDCTELQMNYSSNIIYFMLEDGCAKKYKRASMEVMALASGRKKGN